MSEIVLQVEGLCSGYQGIPVVRDLDLHVEAGEIVALLGANGAGKTTTLLTISGLLRPIEGRVVVLGQDVAGRPPNRIARSGVAHVPESRGVLATLTVAENLAMAAPGGRHQVARAIDEVCEIFPALDALSGRRAGLLSGGEQQMLVLARAFASKPKLLLIDEMSLGLSPIIVDTLLLAVGNAARDQGVGVLMVEQHIPKALSVADRGYVLSHGDLLRAGTADELRANVDELAAAYLGEGATIAR